MVSDITKDIRLKYPPLYKSSSDLSKSSQRSYKSITGAVLACLVIAAFFDAIAEELACAIYFTCAAVIVSVILWLISDRGSNYEYWFDARALTESIKTASWRFAMGAEPYELNATPEKARDTFFDEMEEMLCQEKRVYDKLDYSGERVSLSGPSQSMREIRELPWEQKRQIYLSQRVIDQRNWYSNKAQLNAKWKSISSLLIVILQIAAIIFATMAATGDMLSIAGVLLTLISSIMTWNQVQQRALLEHSYGVAAKELALIESRFERISNAKELSELVAQAELAMSREHTLWISRNAY